VGIGKTKSLSLQAHGDCTAIHFAVTAKFCRFSRKFPAFTSIFQPNPAWAVLAAGAGTITLSPRYYVFVQHTAGYLDVQNEF